jgi:hypothetical protein
MGMNIKQVQVWWAQLLLATTPHHHGQRMKIRSRYQRMSWALGLMTAFFLLTLVGMGAEASSSNGVVLAYLLFAFLFGLLGYLGGLYLSWYLSRLSPLSRLRQKSSKRKS